MAIASASITLAYLRDVVSVTRYYILQSSTLAVPPVPTTNPPGGEWTTTEPSYSSGSTNTLYFVDLTVYSDDSFSCSGVSVSSSYEAAKAAYNKAQAAQDAVAETVQSIIVHYLATASGSGVTTSTSGWTTTVQSVTNTKKYLWIYYTLTYISGDTLDLDPFISGVYGDTGAAGTTGAAGVGISSITEYYAVSSSNSTAPTSWSTAVPTMTATNKYLWSYESILYTNGSMESTTKRVIGAYGDTGESGEAGTDGINGKMLYGTCSTTASTLAKVVSCPEATSLYEGLTLLVQFTTANTASTPTINVNSLGAKNIYVNGGTASASNYFLWGAGAVFQITYNGTYWIPSGYPVTYYGTCSTTAGTKAKTTSITGAVVTKGVSVTVNFTYANTIASATLNVAGTGAKNIYAYNSLLTASCPYNWAANSAVKFTFDGIYWRMDNSALDALALSWCAEADQIYIDGGKIYANSITADKINVSDLFAQDITASGTITGGILQSENFAMSNYSVDEDGNATGTVTSGSKIDLINGAFYTPQITIKDNYIALNGYLSVGSRKFSSVIGEYSFTQGYECESSGIFSHALGSLAIASGDVSHAEGYYTTASGGATHAEGYGTIASGDVSHAEGYYTTASGNGSHAEGSHSNAYGAYSHAEGSSTAGVSGSMLYACHAEGYGTKATGNYGAHSEGRNTTASGTYSHAEGYYTTASGSGAHAEGNYTTASGSYSHASGFYTTASGSYSFVIGKRNATSDALFVVGNGTSASALSDAFVITSDPKAYVGGYQAIDYSDSSMKFGGNELKTIINTKTVSSTSTGYSIMIANGTTGTATSPSASTDPAGIYFAAGQDSTSKLIQMYAVYARTTTSAANVNVTSNGVLCRYSSSSARYKNNIAYVSNEGYGDYADANSGYDYQEDMLALLKLPIAAYRYNDGYVSGEMDYDYDKYQVAFIAEDVAKICPACATYQSEAIYDYNADGERVFMGERKTDIPEAWDEKQMIPRMLYIIQYQNNRIDEMMSELEELKSQMERGSIL